MMSLCCEEHLVQPSGKPRVIINSDNEILVVSDRHFSICHDDPVREHHLGAGAHCSTWLDIPGGPFPVPTSFHNSQRIDCRPTGGKQARSHQGRSYSRLPPPI